MLSRISFDVHFKCIGWKISDMNPGDMLLKNLNIITEKHCKNISFVGDQLIFLSSFIHTWALLSRFKQYLITFLLSV